MAVSAVKSESADAATSPPKKSGKLLIILIIAGVAAAAAGGGVYWYLNQNKNDKSAPAKPQPAKPPVFVPLDAFTVNLQLEEHPQFLQIGLSLKVTDNAVVDSLKVFMPEVRDRILLLLSARKASELLTADGKRKLSRDIVATVNGILAPGSVAKPAPPRKKPPPEPKPPAEGEGAAAEDGEAAAAEEAPPPPPQPVAPPPVLSVLFTSFIIQ